MIYVSKKSKMVKNDKFMDHDINFRPVKHNIMLFQQLLITISIQFFAHSVAQSEQKLRLRKSSRIGSEGRALQRQELFNATLTLALNEEEIRHEQEFQNGSNGIFAMRKKRHLQGYSCNFSNDRHCRCSGASCCSTNPRYQGLTF